MTSSLVLLCDDERLNVVDRISRDVLRLVAETGGTLQWCHKGSVRRIPNAVLRNLIAVYEDHSSIRHEGLAKLARDCPANLGYVTWDQTVSRPPDPGVL